MRNWDYELRVGTEADNEFTVVIQYYARISAQLAVEVFEAIENEMIAIGSNPRRCGWIDDTYRQCRLKRFPYLIVYDPDTQPVVITAISHAKRDPDYWRSRVQ